MSLLVELCQLNSFTGFFQNQVFVKKVDKTDANNFVSIKKG